MWQDNNTNKYSDLSADEIKKLWFDAVKNGHIETAGKLWQNIEIDINEPNKAGDTPLHVAINSGNLEMVEYLISQGADFSKPDKLKQTPLNLAKRLRKCKDKNAIVNFLNTARQSKFDKKKTTANSVANIFMSPEEHRKIMHLEHFATAELVNKDIVKRVIEAIKQGDLALLQSFLPQFGDVDQVIDNIGSTLLHYAAYYESLLIIKYLISEKKADFAKCNNYTEFFLDILLKKGNRDNIANGINLYNEIPASAANNEKHPRVLRTFLNCIAVLENQTLFSACLNFIYDKKRHDDCMLFIKSIFITAIWRRKLENVKYLLERFKPALTPNFMTQDHKVPLLMAIDNEDLDMLNLLLKAGADLHKSYNFSGGTASIMEMVTKMQEFMPDIWLLLKNHDNLVKSKSNKNPAVNNTVIKNNNILLQDIFVNTDLKVELIEEKTVGINEYKFNFKKSTQSLSNSEWQILSQFFATIPQLEFDKINDKIAILKVKSPINDAVSEINKKLKEFLAVQGMSKLPEAPKKHKKYKKKKANTIISVNNAQPVKQEQAREIKETEKIQDKDLEKTVENQLKFSIEELKKDREKAKRNQDALDEDRKKREQELKEEHLRQHNEKLASKAEKIDWHRKNNKKVNPSLFSNNLENASVIPREMKQANKVSPKSTFKQVQKEKLEDAFENLTVSGRNDVKEQMLAFQQKFSEIYSSFDRNIFEINTDTNTKDLIDFASEEILIKQASEEVIKKNYKALINNKDKLINCIVNNEKSETDAEVSNWVNGI